MWDWMGALHMATGYTMQHTHSIMRWLIREPAHLRRVTGVRRDQREHIRDHAECAGHDAWVPTDALPPSSGFALEAAKA